MILPQAYFESKGTSFSTLNRLRVLSELGHQIDLLTYPVGKDTNIENVNIIRVPNIFFVKKVKIGPSIIKFLIDIVVIIYALKLLITRKYDLIHSHEEAGFFSTFFAKIFGKKHIYDMHSSLPQQLTNFEFTKSKVIIKIFSFLEKMTINGADGIIAICPELYEWAKNINSEANVYLIENVLDSTSDDGELVFTPKELRDKYQLNGKKIVLYAGTFETYQGLELFIKSADEVINKCDNVHFLLVGGKPEQVSIYKNQVEQKKLTDHFTFTGSVHPNEIENYYQLSDILVTPRLDGTNTPLKIYAYLRSGKPIVATNHVTHTQVLNEDVAILTDITPQAFADGIIRVLDNEKLGKKLSQEAKKLAETRYSKNHYVKQIKSLLTSLEKEQN